jgi:hypothetical protein
MFRNQADATRWYELTRRMHEHSSNVISKAGSECVPFLLSELAHPDQPTGIATHRWLGYLNQGAYLLHLVDSAPISGQNKAEVRRGQALTAVILLRNQATSLVPRLSELAASQNQDAITAAASYALWEMDPDEFRRIRSPHTPQTGNAAQRRAEPARAANPTQPSAPQMNRAPEAAGASR